ncbi:MAG: adenylate/guanylate cyclase domain-containing protein [Candidatus Sericytochromatia bacterium]
MKKGLLAVLLSLSLLSVGEVLVNPSYSKVVSKEPLKENLKKQLIKAIKNDNSKLIRDLLVKLLDINSFLIFENKGTLDKYTGDGVMAVFGNFGKVNIKENAIRAVKTSVEMTRDLENLQKKWIAQGLMPLQIRIGICTGEVIVGNIGSPKQMDLTVIGDTVNTAARLEKMNKQLNTTILINRTTYEYAKDIVQIHSFGEHLLKGKNRKVEIFEVVNLKQ